MKKDNKFKINLKLDENIDKKNVKYQNITVNHLIRMLKKTNGVILADEVGLGKTYEALAVLAYYFCMEETKKVAILTSNKTMVDEWKNRYEKLYNSNKQICDKLPNPEKDVVIARSFKDFREKIKSSYKIIITSMDTIKTNRDKVCRFMILKNLLKKYRKSKGGNLSKEEKEEIYESLVWDKLRKEEKKEIIYESLAYRSKKSRNEYWQIYRKISNGQAGGFFSKKYFDGKKIINNNGAIDYLIKVELENLMKNKKFDFVIIDEAHKLNSDTTSRVTDIIFLNRWQKMLFLTATPFALDVEELLKLLKKLKIKKEDAKDLELLLKKYVDQIESGSKINVNEFKKLENLLRKYITRRIKESKRSEFVNIIDEKKVKEINSNEQVLFPIFAIESHINKLNRLEDRTHKTNALETFCSSYAAIRKHKSTSNNRNTKYSEFLINNIGNKKESPKFEFTLEWLKEQIKSYEKVLVYSTRRETIKKMVYELNNDKYVKELLDSAHKMYKRISKHIEYISNEMKLSKNKVKILAKIYSQTKEGIKDLKWRNKKEFYFKKLQELKNKLGKELYSKDENNKKISFKDMKVVEKMGGEVEKGRTMEESMIRFNLPSFPLILISGQKGQESIDLHKYCRKILHYDLLWNPAKIEQRIGRIDRIGSLAEREKKEIEIYYAAIPNTYEDKMWKRVRDRQKIFRKVLGAARWIKDSMDDNDDEKYLVKYSEDKDIQINLSPINKRNKKRNL